MSVVVACAVCAWLITRAPAPAAIEPRALHLALLFAAALLAGGIAILGAIGARTLRYPGPAWLGAAFALDGAIVVPVAAFGPQPVHDSPGLLAVAVLADIGMVALLVVARRPPLRLGSLGPWIAAAACAILAVFVGAAGDRWPAVVDAVESPQMALVVGVAWAVVAITSIVAGIRDRERPRWRVGLGLALIALANLYRVAAGVAPLAPELGPVTLHVLGLLGVLSGSAIRLHGEMTSLLTGYEQQQVELSETALHARRAAKLAAERDHELANGLAGLSGIASLLGQPAVSSEAPQLRSAVLAELSRLHELLARSPTNSEDGCYDAAAVVTELAALRRLAGMDVDVDAQGPLEVYGQRNTLAQVITNLLANCERHAPGAAVHIRAVRHGSHAVVELSDDGPGVPNEVLDLVKQRGVSLGGGTGLGLDVSTQLLAMQGGELHLLPRRPDERGFTVRIELPLADQAKSRRPGAVNWGAEAL